MQLNGDDMNELTSEAKKVFDKILALREYTTRTGFKTTRSQNELLQAITNPDDFASVLIALKN